ncbi:MAG: hypothetical protein OEZ59_02030 [Deltaproteobacteria bacterium]|nr:hypothetical protein [Deltaproteobacteria bacterium]
MLFAALLPALFAALFAALPWSAPALAQSENLMDRISNQRMRAFEESVTERIDSSLKRYVHGSRYVLAVRVIWNPEIVPEIEQPQMSQEREKLPGFPIFVRSSEGGIDEATPPYQRLEVKVLLDETLPEYYERFVRKLVPVVGRFDYNRGDQVIVLKETFPVLPKDEMPPTLSEKELMEALGEKYQPGQTAPYQAGMAGMAASGSQGGMPGQVGQPSGKAPGAAEAAQMAFDEGRYAEALRIVQAGFQRSTTARERSFFLAMEGSIHFAQNNPTAARAAWERAVSFDPTNMEVHQVLNYLEAQKPTGNPQ